MVAGGSAPEIAVALGISAESKKMTGMDAYIYRAFAEAFEIVPFTLAEVIIPVLIMLTIPRMLG